MISVLFLIFLISSHLSLPVSPKENGATAIDNETQRQLNYELCLACVYYDYDGAIRLMEMSADPSAHDNYCLKISSYLGNYDLLKYILDLRNEYSKLIDPTVENFRIIFEAIDRHRWDVVDLVLSDDRVKRNYHKVLDLAQNHDALKDYLALYQYYYTTDPVADNFKVLSELAKGKRRDKWDLIDYFLAKLSKEQLFDALIVISKDKSQRLLASKIKSYCSWNLDS